MASITLKGREIPLLYTVYEMKLLQEEIAPFGELRFKLFGGNPENENDSSNYGSPEHLDALTKTIRILGNAGLEEAGEAPDLTDKQIMRALKPGQIVPAVAACMEAMNEGMASEIPQEKSDEPVDVTLEDMKKKKETDS